MQRKIFIRIFIVKEFRYIEEVGYYDDEKYIVDYRAWHKNDGSYIRHWLPNEYLKCNPNNIRTIYHFDNNDNTISDECHCIEARVYAVKRSDGSLITHNTRLFNYREQQFLDMPKNNRCWAMPEEYEDWEFGMNK